jgi:hypothetical protein
MKKQLLSLILIANMSILAFGGYDSPIRTMTIPYAPISFTIDGIDNEAHWSAEQSTDVFNPTGWTGNADYTLTFKVAWDENYLYVFGKILDDINSSWEWGLPNQWTYDNVDLFMDLDTTGAANNNGYDSNIYQVRFNRGIDSVGNDYGRDCQRSDHKYSWKNTSDGWIFEAALAWKFVLGNGQKPEDILAYTDGNVRSGFDINGADSDINGPYHRDCQTAWDNDDDCYHSPDITECSWNNRSIFGIVNFQPRYTSDINEHNKTNLIVYPNPTTGLVTFENLQDSKVEILDLAGQVVLSTTLNNQQIDISMLQAGIYFVKAGQSIIKLIKQ